MATCKFEFLIKPVWVKPWFKNGFTEYHVVRKSVCTYNEGSIYNQYTRTSEEVLHKCFELKEAVDFRANLVNNNLS